MNEEKHCRMTSIGGQALIEGLMMIGPEKRALAVRDPNGEIILEYLGRQKPWQAERIPIVRGSIKLVRQMVLGMKAIFRSADISEMLEDEGDKTQVDQAEEEGARKKTEVAKKGFFDRHPDLLIFLLTIMSLALTIGLFILLPNLVTDLLRRLFNIAAQPGRAMQFALTLVEGLIRVLVFVSYLAVTRLNREIIRVWQYHGSEHKTIACYEAGEELTVENVRKYSRLHPRCGTSFMFLVMIVSIIVLAFVGWHSAWVNLLLRLALLPLIAGISYELIKLAGRYDHPLTRIISWPGLALQKLTTAEPDDAMLEVAITAMRAVIPDDNSDRW